MWLTSSSIGRKFVMAITGICLVLFVTFHVLMNAVAIVWPTAYNVICEFLGANWYALIASVGLAALFIVHIVYASVLTVQNRKARGNDRYAVTSRPPQVEWSSKNMYVLGIVILAFLVVHLIQFWAKMQWQEIRGTEYTVDAVTFAPQFGTLFIQDAFSKVYTPIIYIIGFVALWFHMNHGFWSMMHSVGWDNGVWINRLKCIGCWWTSIVVALFIAQAIVFTVQAHNDHYITDPKLQDQYSEYFSQETEDALMQLQAVQSVAMQQQTPESMEQFSNAIDVAIAKLTPMTETVKLLCPNATNQNLQHVGEIVMQLQTWKSQIDAQRQMMPSAAAQESVEVTEEEVEVTEPQN